MAKVRVGRVTVIIRLHSCSFAASTGASTSTSTSASTSASCAVVATAACGAAEVVEDAGGAVRALPEGHRSPAVSPSQGLGQLVPHGVLTKRRGERHVAACGAVVTAHL